MLQLPDGEINDYQLRIMNQWSINDVLTFTKLYKEKFIQNPKEAKECLNIIYEYKLSLAESKDLDFKNLHKKGIQKLFSESKKNRKIEELIPNHNELVIEMKLENYSNDKDEQIINRVNNIKNLYKSYMNQDINKENIPANLKNSEDDLIAIVMCNLKKSLNIILRDSQLYSLIILLGKNIDKGRIIQVFSGEGKTIITHCLAAVLVFQGHKVDIICGDPHIAKRDSKEAKKILEHLKISVAHNIKVENDCYKKDILYGSIDKFQGGIMRDGYQLNGERQNREFDIVILDEIECMFLDDFSQTTNLVSNKPFYERYSIYLLILWGYYKSLHLNNFDVRDNKELQEKVKNYLSEKLKNFIEIKDDKSEFFFPMSNLLKDFAKNQSEKWVESLIKSLSQRKDVEYTIKKEEIFPIDILDTGLIQQDKSFENGLHQFLQIQNELSVTPISTKTSQNSLSNYGFFKKYKTKEKNSLYGTTGSFGSVKSRELLDKLYKLDFDYIPTNNQFLLRELISNISKNHETWVENILLIVKREVNYGRIVLLLTETVGNCEELFEKISNNFPHFKLYKIIGEEEEKNTLPKKLVKNTVIVSTDMSGRGARFEIDDEVLKNGGMHIIFSFISPNRRKEEKNYKYAGKAGEPGSYQFVLDFEDTMNKYYVNYNIEGHYESYQNLLNIKKKTTEDYNKLNNYSIENIKKIREDRVEERCNNALKKIPNTEKSDYLFNLYCDMVDERKDLRDAENKHCLNSIDEQWGIFLKKMDVDNQTLNNVKSNCQNFKKNIFSELNKGKVVKNPGFYNQYVNEKLGSICFYLRNKNIISEINKSNFREATKYFVKNEEKIFEYNKFIEKCKLAIELDNYSFIPYYLSGICKIISGIKDGIEDLKKSLIYIDGEIQRYLYYFGILISLNINIDLLFYQINILNSIKINVIQKDIDFYLENLDKNSEILIYRKNSKDCFLFEAGKLDDEDEGVNDDEDKNDDTEEKKIFKSIKQYYLNTENNGLNYLFFFQKPNIFKIDSLLSTGIIMIGLSISGVAYLESILNEEIFKEVENMIGTNLKYKEFEGFISKRHERDFPSSQDKSLLEFIKNNNIKIKNTNQDLLDIMKKYDKNYSDRINKEFGKTFRSVLKKKIEKLNLEKYKEFIEDKNENEDEKKYINIALKNIIDLDEKKKKVILANNLLRRDGKDWLTDENRQGKDINERIKNAEGELSPAAEEIIIRELKQSMNQEIKNQRELRDKKNEELSKQKEILADARKNCNCISESYKLRQSKYNERRKKNNDNISQLNKKYDEYNNDQTKYDPINLENERNNLIKEQEDLNKELNELNKDFDVVKIEEEKVEKERLFHNKLVEESNKFNDLANERVELFNNLNNYIKINFSGDELKITFNNEKNAEVSQFDKDLKQIEEDANLAYKEELKLIGININQKEKDKLFLEKRNEFEQVLLKVIKEKNNFWNNCFNQAFSAINYNFNTDDMKQIINNHINDLKKNKGKKNDYYYMKNIDKKKSIEKAKYKLNEDNQIIVGNVYNNNRVWDNYCIINHNNSKYFLYKSNNGTNPPKKLLDTIQEVTGGYVAKVNNNKKSNEKELSEVNAIENNKIIIDEIEKDKSSFVENFVGFANFYNDSRENMLNKIQKSYPEEYIRGLYNEIGRRNNTNRISVILFERFFLNENKDNEIDLEYLNKIYNILMNYKSISVEEKEVLQKEFHDINDVYNNVYHIIKQKEEEEQKEIEEIVKNKYKRSIKNTKIVADTDKNKKKYEIKPDNISNEKEPSEDKKSSNNRNINDERNKENINVIQIEKPKINQLVIEETKLRGKSRNDNSQKNTRKGSENVEICDKKVDGKKITKEKLPLIDNEDPNSKRNLDENNQINEAIFSNKQLIGNVLQGSENQQNVVNKQNTDGNNEESCCQKLFSCCKK